jgi:hypothetical protein
MDALVCAECGEPVKPGRVPGTFIHASRVVAACDLDGDHPAAPRPGHAQDAPGDRPAIPRRASVVRPEPRR